MLNVENAVYFDTEYGTKIVIKYLNNEYDTVPLNGILDIISEVEEKITKFVGKEFWNGIRIEFWNSKRTDIPGNLLQYGGLTFPDQKLIQIPISFLDWNWISNIVCHEIFHLYARFIGFDNQPNDIIKNFLLSNKILFDYYNPVTKKLECTIGEMFAEYCRRLHGSRMCMDDVNDDHGNYPKANTVKGLRDCLLLYKPIVDFVKNKNVLNIKFSFSEMDIGYLFFTCEIKPVFYFWNPFKENIFDYYKNILPYKVIIDTVGIQTTKTGYWKFIKQF